MVLRGLFIALKYLCWKRIRSQVNDLNFHLRKLEKEQIKSKVSRRNKIIKKADISDRNNTKSMKQITGSVRRPVKLINHRPDISGKERRHKSPISRI